MQARRAQFKQRGMMSRDPLCRHTCGCRNTSFLEITYQGHFHTSKLRGSSITFQCASTKQAGHLTWRNSGIAEMVSLSIFSVFSHLNQCLQRKEWRGFYRQSGIVN